MYEIAEDGVLREAFKVFPGYSNFDAYLVLVKEEANYWKGYGAYIEKQIRLSGKYDYLDEGLELVKRATNLRQSIYNDDKLLNGLSDKWLKKAPEDKHGRKMMTPEQMVAFKAEQKKLEERIVLKSFEMAQMREAFKDYLWSAEIEPRQKYSKKVKDDE